MKAIGEVQNVAGAHFVERPALLAFLDAMIAAPSVDEALRARLAGVRTRAASQGAEGFPAGGSSPCHAARPAPEYHP